MIGDVMTLLSDRELQTIVTQRYNKWNTIESRSASFGMYSDDNIIIGGVSRVEVMDWTIAKSFVTHNEYPITSYDRWVASDHVERFAKHLIY
jgi:hypothetical protein